MVKQRFLTHFKPWLVAISKAGALIVLYQYFDQMRTRLQRPPLNVSDVLMAATIVLFVLALLCILRAWGEWCWFKLSSLRKFVSDLQRGPADHRRTQGMRSQ